MKKLCASLLLLVFFKTFMQSQVKYCYDSNKTNDLLKDIIVNSDNKLENAIFVINTKNKKIKESDLFFSDKDIFDSLIFIPVYNVQLKFSKFDEPINYIIFYLELFKYQPINRILVFNKKLNIVCTLYFIKDTKNRDYSFLCYKNNERVLFSTLTCFGLEEYPQKFNSLIINQISHTKFPIYFNVNNFSNELFYLKNDTDLMVISKKYKASTIKKYFAKKTNKVEIYKKASDTVLKYIYNIESLGDTL